MKRTRFGAMFHTEGGIESCGITACKMPRDLGSSNLIEIVILFDLQVDAIHFFDDTFNAINERVNDDQEFKIIISSMWMACFCWPICIYRKFHCNHMHVC